jgi:hypothetical protein
MGFVRVRVAHRGGAAYDVRRTDGLPVFPRRMIVQTGPCLLAIVYGRRFGMIMSWLGQLIGIGRREVLFLLRLLLLLDLLEQSSGHGVRDLRRFGGAQILIADAANGAVVELDLADLGTSVDDPAVPVGIGDVKDRLTMRRR